MEAFDVVIVGAGFSGTLVAAHLMTGSEGPALRIALIERHGPPGRGVAYGTPIASHLLNVPAREMSAYPDDPAHFLSWLARAGHAARPEAFVERRVYGAYVGAVLDEAIARARADRELTTFSDEAVGCLPEAGRFHVRLASGRVLRARQVVLALGQFPPASLRLGTQADWLVDDPWVPEAIAPLPPGSRALLVGTGLSAIDVALALLDHGAAHVTLISRRAQLPAPQREGAPYRDWLAPDEAPLRISRLLARVRAEVRTAEGAGADWRGVVDTLRPHVGTLWARLPWVERRRFMRHARSYWESHRNRLPPPSAERVRRLIAEGRLEVLAGRVRAVEATGDGAIATLALRGGDTRQLPIARLVNCTGPDTQYRRIGHPLVLDLIGTGLARPDPLGLGLDVSADGRLRDEDGDSDAALYTLGWPRLGQLWEATAVSSLREQARDVAQALLRAYFSPLPGA